MQQQKKFKHDGDLPPILRHEDFYPPNDPRELRAGDFKYYSYLNEFFELCDEEEIYDEKILTDK